MKRVQHDKLSKMAKTKSTNNTKCRQGWGTNETITHYWGMGVGRSRSVIQSLGKIRFSYYFNMYSAYDPVIVLFAI